MEAEGNSSTGKNCGKWNKQKLKAHGTTATNREEGLEEGPQASLKNP